MSRANPFGDLDDFAADPVARPLPSAAIERIAEATGFPAARRATPAAPMRGEARQRGAGRGNARGNAAPASPPSH